jgi:hypothetical protein
MVDEQGGKKDTGLTFREHPDGSKACPENPEVLGIVGWV